MNTSAELIFGGREINARNLSSNVLILAIAMCVGLLPVGAHAEVIELEGTVKAVDATARTITIERKSPKGTKTLELEVNKKAGDLASVKVGDRIAFSYDPDLELVTRIGSGNGKTTQPQTSAYKASPASKGPGEREKEICKEFCRRLEQDHYLQPKIDRDLVARMIESSLRNLDPMKMYFRQADIDEFMQKTADLPSALENGDVVFFYDVYKRLIERVEALLPVIEAQIRETHDFSSDEFIEMDRAKLAWPRNDDEAKDKWRKRIKYDMLVEEIQGTKNTDASEKLLRRYRSYGSRMRIMTSDQLLECFLSALAVSVDSASNFISPESMANFEIGMRMELDGIGAALQGKDGEVTVVSLTPGGAAARDGRLKPNDRVVGIAQGTSQDFVDVDEMSLNDVVNLVRGKRGTVVRLKVIPVGRSSPQIYDITRAKIELGQSVAVKGEVFEEGVRADGSPRKIGVIRVPSLYGPGNKAQGNAMSASKDCKALLEGFRLQNVESVVLDLRSNGGGAFPEVVSMVGLFIDRGRVVQIKNKDGRVEKLDDNETGKAWAGPLVVVVDELTGGGAEVVAAAIQDHNRGIIVGSEVTMGNAAVLNVLKLDEKLNLGSAKFMWQGLYRATGEGLLQKGVHSDVVLPTELGYTLRGFLQRGGGAAFDRIGRDGFTPSENGIDAAIKTVQQKSVARTGSNPEFKKAAQTIQALKERQANGGTPLKRTEFTKLWNDGQRDESEPPLVREESKLQRDFYLDEVIKIAADLSSTGPTR